MAHSAVQSVNCINKAAVLIINSSYSPGFGATRACSVPSVQSCRTQYTGRKIKPTFVSFLHLIGVRNKAGAITSEFVDFVVHNTGTVPQSQQRLIHSQDGSRG